MTEPRTSCLLCGEEFDSQAEMELHHAEAHEGESDDDSLRWWQWIIAIPVMLIMGWRYVFGFFFVVAVVLALLGVFDKTKVPDSKNCPGYGFVRSLKAKGQIATFESVEPEDGWKCEYSLDNDDAEVRFKKVGSELELEVEGRPYSEAYEAADREAKAEGYGSR